LAVLARVCFFAGASADKLYFFPLVISGMLLERQESLGDVNPISKGSLAGEFK